MTDSTIDPNTDNLDDFDKLLRGQAQPTKDDTPPAAPAKQVSKAEASEDEPQPETEESKVEVEEAEIADDTSATEDDEADPKPEDKPKKNRFQERIDDLTRKAREADRRAAELERKLNEFTAPKEEKQPEVKAGPTPEDKLEDGSEKYPLGEFDPAYIRDLTRHTIQQEREAYEADAKKQSETRASEEATARLVDEWKGKLDNAIENKYPDFLEKNADLEDTFRDIDEGLSNYLATTIMQMDNGTDVLYYLASNPSEARRIAGLGATKATIALGRIEASFDEPKEQRKQPKVSAAPPPPETNRGTSVAKTVAPDTDDLDAFEEVFYKRKR